MYVIFPLDHLLDIGTAQKRLRGGHSYPPHPQAGSATTSPPQVPTLSPPSSPPSLSSPTPAQLPDHPKAPQQQQVPQEQRLGNPVSVGGTQASSAKRPSSNQRPDRLKQPQQQQEKPLKGGTLSPKAPSTLPSHPVAAQALQHQLPTTSPLAGGVRTTTCLNSSTCHPQGLQQQQRRAFLFQPVGASAPQHSPSSLGNASARASWAGSPTPARDRLPEITQSATSPCFLNRTDLLPPLGVLSFPSPPLLAKSPSFPSVVVSRRSRSDSPSQTRQVHPQQKQVVKCDIPRNELINSNSCFEHNREFVSPLTRERRSKSSKPSRSPPGQPPPFVAPDPKPERIESRDAVKPDPKSVTSSGQAAESGPGGTTDSKQYPESKLGPEKPDPPRTGSSFRAEPKFDSIQFEIADFLGILSSDVSPGPGGVETGVWTPSGSSSLGRAINLRRGRSPPIAGLHPAGVPSRKVGVTIMASEPSFKDLSHPALNEPLKSYNAVTFKLIKTVSDFSSQLSRLHERHAEDLQLLVENYRKKHSDLRNERPPCASHMFQAWETLLQEVEVDSQLHSDVAGTFVRGVSRPLIEKTFHRKIQSRKLFTHRESLETILGKTEEMLKKCRRDLTEAYQTHCRAQNNSSLAAYFDAHNAYVQQLHAINAMLQHYHNNTQPTVLQELENTHVDVHSIFMESIMQGSDALSTKALEQSKRYENLGGLCRSSGPRADVVALVKHLDTPSVGQKGIPQHRFILPQPPALPEGESEEPQATPEPPAFPPLKNELVLDRLAALSSRTRLESLRREAADLEKQIAQLQEGMDALIRVQVRNLESSLYHKANELQEDISMKRFDLRVNQVHLAAVKAQKELFASKEGPSTDSRDRKLSSASTGSMKSKWMKAFKSLKTTSGGSSGGPSGSASGRDSERKNGRDRGMDPSTAFFENSHILQEYTYKKITACDVCHQILRGHSRQGLKCRLCKTNVHLECQEKLPKCQPKSRLLRRQRSTSEIESKQIDAGDDEREPVFSINTLIASQPGRRMRDPPPSPSASTSGASQFPLPPKGPSSSSSSTSNPAPSSPVHNRRLLSTRNMRMSSVELPDDNEKSLSSTSASPCPSPVNKKPQRLLPTNLYVVLYNFTSRHPDELDLRAGYKVTVTDTSDPDWWQGKCLGRTGFFPSKYVTRLNAGEKPLQVTHNLQVSDGENGIKLLRDQIVIQIGEEIDGMVMIRNGDNQQGVCPVKYLQEA